MRSVLGCHCSDLTQQSVRGVLQHALPIGVIGCKGQWIWERCGPVHSIGDCLVHELEVAELLNECGMVRLADAHIGALGRLQASIVVKHVEEDRWAPDPRLVPLQQEAFHPLAVFHVTAIIRAAASIREHLGIGQD